MGARVVFVRLACGSESESDDSTHEGSTGETEDVLD